jgi:hypothetical protein
MERCAIEGIFVIERMRHGAIGHRGKLSLRHVFSAQHPCRTHAAFHRMRDEGQYFGRKGAGRAHDARGIEHHARRGLQCGKGDLRVWHLRDELGQVQRKTGTARGVHGGPDIVM